MPSTNLTISKIWNAARLVQTALNKHLECHFHRCRDQEYCTGGPRKTCTLTGGFPLCHIEGRQRLQYHRRRTKWFNDLALEPGFEEEAPSARTYRRVAAMNEEVMLLTAKAGALK